MSVSSTNDVVTFSIYHIFTYILISENSEINCCVRALGLHTKSVSKNIIFKTKILHGVLYLAMNSVNKC